MAAPPGSQLSPGSGTTRSSRSPSRQRLVTSTTRSGMAAWIWLTSAAAPLTCSNVSSTSINGSRAISWARPAHTPATMFAPEAIGPDIREGEPAVQARKIAPATPDRSSSANGTKTTLRDCRSATSIATLVLPTPPCPVMVTRRHVSSSSHTLATSDPRPIMGVRGDGRPCRSGASVVLAMVLWSVIDVACACSATRCPGNATRTKHYCQSQFDIDAPQRTTTGALWLRGVTGEARNDHDVHLCA